jgi:hypothetical protein
MPFEGARKTWSHLDAASFSGPDGRCALDDKAKAC